MELERDSTNISKSARGVQGDHCGPGIEIGVVHVNSVRDGRVSRQTRKGEYVSTVDGEPRIACSWKGHQRHRRPVSHWLTHVHAATVI